MNKKLISVSVGIPAHNEEKNIKKLLEAILSQKQTFYELLEVIVVLDGCTDETFAKIKSVKAKEKIKVLINRERKGQNYSQNRIFSQAKGDALILFEADTYPTKNCLNLLVKKMKVEKSAGLIQGNISLGEPKTFVGKAISDQINQYHEYVLSDESQKLWFATGRGARMFPRKVYEKLRWPGEVPEDIYALLWCKRKNIKVSYEAKAKCVFCAPQTIADFVKTRQKVRAGEKSLYKYFDKSLISRVYKKPLFLRLKMLLSFVIQRPFSFLTYTFLEIYLLTAIKSEFTDFWPVSISTKRAE